MTGNMQLLKIKQDILTVFLHKTSRSFSERSDIYYQEATHAFFQDVRHIDVIWSTAVFFLHNLYLLNSFSFGASNLLLNIFTPY